MSQGMSLGDCVSVRECVCAHTSVGSLFSQACWGWEGEVVARRTDANKSREEGRRWRSIPQVQSLPLPHESMPLAKPPFLCGEADPGRTGLDASL